MSLEFLFDPLTISTEFLARPFPSQDAFVHDTNQFIAAKCTRRAGKSSGLARRFIKTMQKHPRSLCRYLALTRDSAKEIMWSALQDEFSRQGLAADFRESDLTVTLISNGARLRLYGADMKNFAKRLKGAKSPGIAIDEAQDFQPDVLVYLVDDVLTPTMADYDGAWLALTGTPGPVPRGLFYEITHEGRHGYSNHAWSIYENPYLPNARKWVEDYRIRKGWDLKHPTFLREWQGLWVLDLESLLYKWDERANHYDTLPPGTYEYITGIDIGWRDADALATLAWRQYDRTIYLVEEQINTGADITDLSERIASNYKRYQSAKMPIDAGALGKKIVEELRRRFGLNVHPVDKLRKMEYVALLNDYMRRGLFKAKRDSRFVKDSLQLQIDHDKSTPDRLVVKKGFHSDICDAVLYGFRECPAWVESPQVKRAPYGSAAWGREEEDLMEQAAQDAVNTKEPKGRFDDMGNQEQMPDDEMPY